ncbi:MAG: flagellar motor protein [Acidobacteria bacterium]|nr:MAG: flagellar motor protein [Acidobacteriota bacterium]
MDRSSFLGIFIAVAGILIGLTLDGGNIFQILQPTAAMIVFGGTLGAVMLQFPLEEVMRGAREAKKAFFYADADLRALIDRIVGYAQKARKDGIVSLDKDLDSIPEPFLRKTLMLAVDGTQAAELRGNMEREMSNHSEVAGRSAEIFDAAGGFSPTIGIIGAILGLIQVMQHLNDINEVGRGIAVAFVATVYGVASANLFFLPIAGKLRVRKRQKELMHEIMLDGVIGILEGMNPRMLQTKLQGYLAEKPDPKKAAAEEQPQAAGAPASAEAART